MPGALSRQGASVVRAPLLPCLAKPGGASCQVRLVPRHLVGQLVQVRRPLWLLPQGTCQASEAQTREGPDRIENLATNWHTVKCKALHGCFVNP